MQSVVMSAMRDIPVGWRREIRNLTEGPDLAWGMWSWTHSDGSTYASMGFDHVAVRGWAGLTMEIDVLPVLGCYVHPDYRGRGWGQLMVVSLLTWLLGQGQLHSGSTLFATTSRWRRYVPLVESCGLRCLEWK